MRATRNTLCLVGIVVCLFACAVGFLGCPNMSRARYMVDVERYFDTEQEAALILAAENMYNTDRERMWRHCYPYGTDINDIPEDAWWYFDYVNHNFDEDFRLCYAITADAIDYYTELVEEDRATRPLPEWSAYPGAYEKFEYAARIAYHPTFEGRREEVFSDVYVVTMNLKWSKSAGPVRTMGFYKDRLVVLTPGGEVLHVQGDGPIYDFMNKAN